MKLLGLGSVTSQFWQYLGEVWIELKKVQWPGWYELLSATLVTLLLVAFFCVYLTIVDKLVGWVIFDWIYKGLGV